MYVCRPRRQDIIYIFHIFEFYFRRKRSDVDSNVNEGAILNINSWARNCDKKT
jgi:hypothetical protein